MMGVEGHRLAVLFLPVLPSLCASGDSFAHVPSPPTLLTADLTSVAGQGREGKVVQVGGGLAGLAERTGILSAVADHVNKSDAPATTETSASSSPPTLHNADAATGGADTTAPMSAATPSDAQKHHTIPAAVAELLFTVQQLRADGKQRGSSGDWKQASKLYTEACARLEEAADSRAEVAEQLQACRLNLALCYIKRGEFEDAIRVCTQALASNGRCGSALFRRGQALQASGRVDAALWDFQRSAELLPRNKQVAAALAQAQSTQRSLVGAKRPRSSLAADAAALPSLESLFGELSGDGRDGGGGGGLSALLGAAGGADGAAGGGGLADLLGGLGGAKGGGADAANLLESVLASPLLGGGKPSGLLGALGMALAWRRRAMAVWTALKPYVPLLFYLVLLAPLLHAVLAGRRRPF